MSDLVKTTIPMYSIFVGEHQALIMRLDTQDGETTLCIVFSKVSGKFFLQECIRNSVLDQVDFDSFEKLWNTVNLPDFHSEEETILDGHTAELLCMYLEVYIDLLKAQYNLNEVYEVFKEECCVQYHIPFLYKPAKDEPLEDFSNPKDLSALAIVSSPNTVKFYFDKTDALSLMDLSKDMRYKKRTRKHVLHSDLPSYSIEPIRTYTGLTGELIAYLFWMNEEFGW